MEEALATVAEQLLEAKTQVGRAKRSCRIPTGGSNGLLTQDTSDATLFRRLGASRLARDRLWPRRQAPPTLRCSAKMPSVTYADFSRSAA
jgi:hypothetical protein